MDFDFIIKIIIYMVIVRIIMSRLNKKKKIVPLIRRRRGSDFIWK